MSAIAAIFLWYPLFGIPAILGGFLVWLFVRRRIRLQRADWLLLVLPWAAWIGLMLAEGTGKSLSNLIEAFYLGCGAAVFFAARSALEVLYPGHGKFWSYAALLAACLAAAALWAFVPALPE